jgi:hypothetical protein
VSEDEPNPQLGEDGEIQRAGVKEVQQQRINGRREERTAHEAGDAEQIRPREPSREHNQKPHERSLSAARARQGVTAADYLDPEIHAFPLDSWPTAS